MSESLPADVASGNNAVLAKDVADLKVRIDDIVAFQKRKEPWYRDTGVFISVAAFFISIVTSGITAYRTYKQDVNSREDALQAVIQQFYTSLLNSISMQYAFRKDEYSGSNYSWSGPLTTESVVPGLSANTSVNNIKNAEAASTAATSHLFAANIMLAKKALSLVDELGNNASSLDLYETAYMLQTANYFDLSERLYGRAMDRASNSLEYTGAARGRAQVLYVIGKNDAARDTMKQALDVFVKFANESPTTDYVNWTHYQIYYYWISNVGINDCKLSKELLPELERYAGQLLKTTATNSGVNYQLGQLKDTLVSCGS